MTTMSNLPKELVEEIIIRVPLKSMKAVRLTSRKWYALLKSWSFTTKHIGNLGLKKVDETRMIVMKDHNVHFMSVFLDENPSTKPLGKLTCINNNEQVKISEVFHCDGLLLCILKDDNTRLVVWNPYLGQTRVIKTTYFGGRNKYNYGIGYEEKHNSGRRSYKILRFMDDNVIYANIGRCGLWYEIYKFDSDSWTTNHLSVPWDIWFCDGGVSLKGNTYWLATDEQGFTHCTICFDFTRMRFGGLQYLPFWAWPNPLISLSCVGDEELAVLFQVTTTSMIYMWITNKIDEHKVLWGKCLKVNDTASKLSWIQFLTIDVGPFTGLRNSVARFLVEEEKKVAIIVNKDSDERLDTVKIFGEDGYSSELELGEPLDRNCWPLVCSYVPSLVQIKLPEGVKKENM